MQKHILTLGLLFLLVGCKKQATPSKQDEQKEISIAKETPGFIHTVYFYLKNDISDEQRKEFIDEALPALAQVESIQSVWYGPPAMTPRNLVDNTYDIAWITTFESSADHDAYQVDELHEEFRVKYGNLFEKVQIYDNLVSN